MEYDLHILHLSGLAIWSSDGEVNKVVPLVRFEPWGYFALAGAVAPLVQWGASGGGSVGGLIWVVSIFKGPYEGVLSWIEVPFAHVAGGVAPQATRCRCTDWRSASLAAIFALLLATAFANCSSFHIEQTFHIAICDSLRYFEGDRQRDLAQMTVFRSPNVGIDVLDVGLVGRGCSHVARV